MFKTLAFALIFLVAACSPESHPEDGGYDNSVFLSAPERKYIAETVVRVGVGAARGPFVIVDADKTVHGLAPDYLKLIAEKTGLKIQYVQFSTLADGMRLFQEKKIDVIPAMPITQARTGAMSFTDPYLTISSTMLLKGLPAQFPLQVGVGRGYAIESYLGPISSQVQLVPFDTNEQAFAELLKGNLGAIILSSAEADYLEQKFHKTFSRASVDFEQETAFAYQKDNPTLGLILQKGLEAINEEEHRKIQANWLSPKSAEEAAENASAASATLP